MLHSQQGLIIEEEQETTEAIEEEDKVETERPSMFNMLKRLITNIGEENDCKPLQVTHPDFWPQIIARCGKDWPQLAHQPGIPRLLFGFDPSSMNFSE